LDPDDRDRKLEDNFIYFFSENKEGKKMSTVMKSRKEVYFDPLTILEEPTSGF
jgi:hypothetical protein